VTVTWKLLLGGIKQK